MVILSIDTCDQRGSVCVLQGETVVIVEEHGSAEDYSSWLIPAMERVLRRAGLSFPLVDLYAVASGPGSFTGLRVGLATIKGLAEVFGRPIAAASRLEGLAVLSQGTPRWVATFVDAQRGQVFGAVYRKESWGLSLVGDTRVLMPEEFITFVAGIAPLGQVAWVSPDPEPLRAEGSWRARDLSGESIQPTTAVLAPVIGRIGYRRAQEGKLLAADELEANYVRRSDAEIFWKSGSRPASHGR